MGVYIKGMEMLKVAGRTDAVIQIYKDGSAIIAISPADDGIGYWKEYPLIPVPDHGDLIDREALVKNCMREDSFIAEMLFRKVSNAPTIIPADKGVS